ncbi:MAG: mechanosensitive ion channel family protein [Candidatus Thorarchaeota archaeon]
MQTAWDDFVNIFVILLEPLGLQDYASIVAIIPFMLLIYLIYLVTIRSIKISFRKMGVPREGSAGIVFMVRLIFFGIAVGVVIAVTGVLGGGGVTIGALLGTAIGLAFSRALSNLVSGIYLFGARPFRVGDYIRVGDVEGLVIEITLNYTRLLTQDFSRIFVPNGKIVDSQLTNFRIRLDDYLAERGIKQQKSSTPQSSKRGVAVDKLKYLTKGDEIFRYTFEVNIHKDYPLSTILAEFNRICDAYTEKFLERPEYFFVTNVNTGIIYSFTYIVKDPNVILREGSNFQSDISHVMMRTK